MMPPSIPQRIIDAVKATLTDAAPEGVTVKKGRKAPKNEPGAGREIQIKPGKPSPANYSGQ